jgi:hypothetical protein
MPSDFTHAIVEVMQDTDTALSPADILAQVWERNPGEFQLCTVIDVCHEKEAVYDLLD